VLRAELLPTQQISNLTNLAQFPRLVLELLLLVRLIHLTRLCLLCVVFPPLRSIGARDLILLHASPLLDQSRLFS
jgi:hypothetical protein